MPHTVLLLSYLCKAPLWGGSIAEVWSFISSAWLHLHQDTSGTLRRHSVERQDIFYSTILEVLMFPHTQAHRDKQHLHTCRFAWFSGLINRREDVIDGVTTCLECRERNTRMKRVHSRLFNFFSNEWETCYKAADFHKANGVLFALNGHLVSFRNKFD